MKLRLSLPAQSSLQQVVYLKGLIVESAIDGIGDVEIERASVLSDGMSGLGNFANTIVAVVSASSRPLSELVKCLNTFIENFRTEVEISVGDKKVVLKSGNLKQSEELVKTILQAIKD